MRKVLMLAVSVTLLGSLAANAQEPSTPQQPPQPPAASPDAAPTIQRINVLDVSELPQEAQAQVTKIMEQTSSESLQKMHSTIESVPEAKAALEAKGASPTQVVATSMSKDGTLTLITKKAS